MSEDKTIDILLDALKQRYDSLRTIRERTQNICLWTLRILLGAGGWLIQSDRTFNLVEKLFFSLIILFAFIVVRCFYLVDLAKGFKIQQKVAVNIELMLGLYNKGLVANFGSPYPEGWKEAGSDSGPGRFIKRNYLLLYTGTIILLAVIWLKNIC